MIETFLLLSGGVLAGALGGLLGIGGGVVLMPLLRFEAGLDPAQAAGTCVVAVFFTTLGGGYRHLRKGNVDPDSIFPVIITGLLACAGCCLLFAGLARRGQWLDLGVGLVFSLVSLRIFVEGLSGTSKRNEPTEVDKRVRGKLAHKIGIGALAGALPGLLGIGTGGILVPAFSLLLKTPVKTAMAASLVCFALNALVSSAFKMAQGYIDASAAVPVCAGTLLGAYLGAVLNRHFSSGVLKLMFGVVFFLVSAKFIVSGVR